MKKSATAYLIFARLRNTFFETLHKPARLIYFIFIIALFGLMMFTRDVSAINVIYPTYQFGAIVLALFFAMFALVTYGGFSSGGSIFRMADVNLLFLSPISSRRVLIYGVVQQMETALLLAIFIPFQVGWMYPTYGIGTFSDIVILMLGYAFIILSSQLVAMVIYSYTSANEKLKKTVKFIFFALLAITVAVVVGFFFHNDDLSIGGLAFTAFKYGRFFPVAGWLSAAVIELISGSLVQGLIWLAATVLAVSVPLFIFVKNTPDYYEDVLATAEKTQTVIAAQRDGVHVEASPKNVKLGKEGFGAGFGASVLYFKHRTENRRSGLLMLSPSTIIFAVITVVYSLILKVLIGTDDTTVLLVTTIAFGTYLQIFGMRSGWLPAELTKPYIYLIPESSFSKLSYALLESVPRFLVESALVSIPLKFIFGLGITEALGLLVFRFSVSLVLTAAGIVHSRIFGFGKNKGLSMMFFVLCCILLLAPAAVTGLLCAIALEGSVVAFCLVAAAVNVPVTLLCLFLCRNMLDNAECNS